MRWAVGHAFSVAFWALSVGTILTAGCATPQLYGLEEAFNDTLDELAETLAAELEQGAPLDESIETILAESALGSSFEGRRVVIQLTSPPTDERVALNLFWKGVEKGGFYGQATDYNACVEIRQVDTELGRELLTVPDECPLATTAEYPFDEGFDLGYAIEEGAIEVSLGE